MINVDFTEISNPIIKLLNSMIEPLLMVVVAFGAIYCIYLGVKYARAKEPDAHIKAKKHLIHAIEGYLLIFVLLKAMQVLTPALVEWAAPQEGVVIQSSGSSAAAQEEVPVEEEVPAEEETSAE